MKSLEVLRALLEDRVLSKIAEKTGISRQTLIAIRDGANTNPEHNTLKKISDYFEDQEQQVASLGK